MMVLKQGTQLKGGEYKIKRMLGQGGFGITYLAEQVSLGRMVAIKEFFMRDKCLRNTRTGHVTVPPTGSSIQVNMYREKFKKEARTIARLDHPYIIGIIDVWSENSTVYYSMPYMLGGSLRDFVATRGRLNETEALSYIKQVADALKYMHDRRVCHFDVKPANILLDREGNATLIDFGISKNYDVQGKETSNTPIGISEGFAPIEQYQNVKDFSPTSDIYALGATLYFLVMGKVPPTAPTLVQSGNSLVFDSRVSYQVRKIISSAMKINISDRPQSIAGFLQLFPRETPPGHATISTTKPSSNSTANEKPTGHKKSHVVRNILVGLLLCLLAAGNYYLITHDSKEFIEQLKESIGWGNEGKEKQKQQEKFHLDSLLNKLEADMVLINGGTFVMGENKGIYKNGKAPAEDSFYYQVSLSNYYICRYEVTQELWEAVMGNNPSFGEIKPQHPVNHVSWNDCQDFILKLNEMTGKQYRLPTEAEWEYAARGGLLSKGYDYSGSNKLNSVAWFDGNSGKQTHPVGQKAPNEFGLYDMSGNVEEFCQDWYESLPHNKPLQFDPVGPSEGDGRVTRGGSYFDGPNRNMVFYRTSCNPSDSYIDKGLRLAL